MIAQQAIRSEVRADPVVRYAIGKHPDRHDNRQRAAFAAQGYTDDPDGCGRVHFGLLHGV